MKTTKRIMLLGGILLASAPMLIASNTRENNTSVGIETSCGRKIITVKEEGSGMSEAEYDEWLRDLNQEKCGTRERPNIIR